MNNYCINYCVNYLFNSYSIVCCCFFYVFVVCQLYRIFLFSSTFLKNSFARILYSPPFPIFSLLILVIYSSIYNLCFFNCFGLTKCIYFSCYLFISFLLLLLFNLIPKTLNLRHFYRILREASVAHKLRPFFSY